MPGQFTNYGGQSSRTKNWAEYQDLINKTRANPNARGGRSGQDVARAVLGGPVGWYEIASGKSLLGNSDPFSGTTLNLDMTEEVYNSMSPEEWASFAHMSGQEQADFVAGRKKALGQATEEDAKAAAELKAQQDKEAQYQAWRTKKMQELDAFSQKMGMSVEELIASGDLGINAARNDAAAQAGRRGLGLTGGISDMNSQRAVADAGLRYQMQRQQMGLQATGQLMQGLQQQYMNDEDRRRYEQGLNLQLQQATAAGQYQRYLQNQQQQAGMYGLAGTVIGGIAGGWQGAQAGGQLGMALGSQQYGASNPYRPYQYQYPTGSSGGGGLTGSSNRGPTNYQ